MSKSAYYEGTREVRTFVDLNHGADVLLQIATDQREGSYYTTMASILLTAFTLEAYLNHLGQRIIPFWEQIEVIRVLDKYSVLCTHLGVEPNFSERPYQTLKSLFRFRNAIAHGKSVVLEEQKMVSASSNPSEHTPRTEWEEYSTEANAIRAREDIQEVIAELHLTAGLGKHPFVSAAAVSVTKLVDSESDEGSGS